MTNSEKIEHRATELYYRLSPLSSATLWMHAPLKEQASFRRMAIDELAPVPTEPPTVTIAFTEWHDGDEVGSGDAVDIEALRQAGELLPELAALWDAMAATLTDDDAPDIPPVTADVLAAARDHRPLWDGLLTELRKQVAADEAEPDRSDYRGN